MQTKEIFCPNFDFVFRENFGQISSFAKFEKNFAKHEIENFAKLRKRQFFADTHALATANPSWSETALGPWVSGAGAA